MYFCFFLGFFNNNKYNIKYYNFCYSLCKNYVEIVFKNCDVKINIKIDQKYINFIKIFFRKMKSKINNDIL